jgi:hypothetical protein
MHPLAQQSSLHYSFRVHKIHPYPKQFVKSDLTSLGDCVKEKRKERWGRVSEEMPHNVFLTHSNFGMLPNPCQKSSTVEKSKSLIYKSVQVVAEDDPFLPRFSQIVQLRCKSVFCEGEDIFTGV